MTFKQQLQFIQYSNIAYFRCKWKVVYSTKTTKIISAGTSNLVKVSTTQINDHCQVRQGWNLSEWLITKSQRQTCSKLRRDQNKTKLHHQQKTTAERNSFSKPTTLCSIHKLHCLKQQQKLLQRGLKDNCLLIFLPCRGRDVTWCCTPTENSRFPKRADWRSRRHKGTTKLSCSPTVLNHWGWLLKERQKIMSQIQNKDRNMSSLPQHM